MNYIGIDIGGTKCAVSLGCSDGQGRVRILYKCPKAADGEKTAGFGADYAEE